MLHSPTKKNYNSKHLECFFLFCRAFRLLYFFWRNFSACLFLLGSAMLYRSIKKGTAVIAFHEQPDTYINASAKKTYNYAAFNFPGELNNRYFFISKIILCQKNPCPSHRKILKSSCYSSQSSILVVS